MKRFGLLVGGLMLALLSQSNAADSSEKISMETPGPVVARPGGTASLTITVNVLPGWHIQSSKPADEFLIPTRLDMQAEPGIQFGPVQYPATETIESAGQKLQVFSGKVLLTVPIALAPTVGAGKHTLHGTLQVQACDENTCVAPSTLDVGIPIEVSGTAQPVTQPSPAKTRSPPQPGGIPWTMLLGAFVGGLLLNLMPCVLPVISLKILGFVQQGGDNPRQTRQLGLLYAAGVIVSLWALAAVVVALKAAGQQVGWGFQFQDVRFVLALALLCTVIALNLFGLFEFSLGNNAADKVNTLAGHGGKTGAFLNGILAVLLATPCTAPFLAPALGFAFAASATVIFAVLTAVAFGLALPYVLLSWNVQWMRWLPKPGMWLISFKQGMAFPMLATALWLAWVVGTSRGATAGMGVVAWLLTAAFLVWLAGTLRPGQMRWIVVALVLTAGLGHWKLAPLLAEAASVDPTHNGLIDWKPYSKSTLEEALKTSRPVFVDFTASWCLTCQVNKRTSLEVTSVAARFKELNVIPLLADWTRPNSEIGDALKALGRSGVPAYVLYPATPGREPILLPEVLTPQMVLDALNKAR